MRALVPCALCVLLASCTPPPAPPPSVPASRYTLHTSDKLPVLFDTYTGHVWALNPKDRTWVLIAEPPTSR